MQCFVGLQGSLVEQRNQNSRRNAARRVTFGNQFLLRFKQNTSGPPLPILADWVCEETTQFSDGWSEQGFEKLTCCFDCFFSSLAHSDKIIRPAGNIGHLQSIPLLAESRIAS